MLFEAQAPVHRFTSSDFGETARASPSMRTVFRCFQEMPSLSSEATPILVRA